ncbi:MAG: hypothetical protein K2H46_03835 [Muribaculaceae bacterium]|nr:hypothetical protein [Muribaculaceae bacterium]
MIDPKELRIGSHYYNGSYVEPIIGRVLSIDGSASNPDDIQVGLIYDMPLDNNSDPYEAAMAHYLEPIPLTPDVLNELGFHQSIMCGEWIVWAKDIDSITIQVAFQDLVCKDAEIKDNDDKKAMFGWSCPCQYLHELESFLWMCAKTELIELIKE